MHDATARAVCLVIPPPSHLTTEQDSALCCRLHQAVRLESSCSNVARQLLVCVMLEYIASQLSSKEQTCCANDCCGNQFDHFSLMTLLSMCAELSNDITLQARESLAMQP